MNIESALLKLSKSKFRSSFHLKKKDIEYIKEKGWDTIHSHCNDFILKKLAPAVIPNDGKQTPTHGHPVFVAQHACACCCRSCLSKWYKIEKGINLRQEEINNIVDLLLAWMFKEFENFKEITYIRKIQKTNTNKTPLQLKLF